jgi:hypothetical protein
MGKFTKGLNASRLIFNQYDGIASDHLDSYTQNEFSNFQRGVVRYVLNDPDGIPAGIIEELSTNLNNPISLNALPRNSLVVELTKQGASRRGFSKVLAYSFLPPHLSLPIKTGEEVWVMTENAYANTYQFYWLWRTTQPENVDDLNYTHAPRKFQNIKSKSASERAKSGSASKDKEKLSFSDGPGREDEKSFNPNSKNEYDAMIKKDPSYGQFNPEAVPRFKKRPGDTVIQGTNNTLIVLGEDRTDGTERAKPQSGTIDIVTGRGQGEKGGQTASNDRGNLEIDKRQLNGKSTSDNEGNPDFETDLSRVYISSKTSPDENFEIKYPNRHGTGQFKQIEEAASVIIKSNEIRLISREEGSIRITKEGEKSSHIIMMDDGSVRMDGDIIYIGSPGGSGPGPSGSEPYIKFSEYKRQINGILDITTDINDTLKTLSAGLTLTPAGGPAGTLASLAVGPPGAPGPLDAKISSLKIAIDQAKSQKIFGE